MTNNLEQARELLGCPFCGGPAELEEVDGGWSVGCEEKALSVHYCMGYQSLTSFATKHEAIAAWNTRPNPAPPADVERVAGAIMLWLVTQKHMSLMDNEYRDLARAALSAIHPENSHDT